MVLVQFLRIIWGLYDQNGNPVDMYGGKFTTLRQKAASRMIKPSPKAPEMDDITLPKWYPLVI